MSETLPAKFFHALLLPGDLLLYDRVGIVSTLIKLKRGEKYSHCEVYEGGNKTLASRDGIGVRRFDLRLDGLAAIYRTRPEVPYFFSSGQVWFTTVDGQGYDWFGLLNFWWAKFQGRANNKMFCSEFIVRFFARCGVHLFSEETDADAISPGSLPYSPRLFPVWVRKDKRHDV